MLRKYHLTRYLGYAMTLLLFAAAVNPHFVRIPAMWRPWVFLGWIVSFFLSATGFFG